MDTAEVDALVSPEWVDERLEAFGRDDPEYRLVEVDAYPETYRDAHVPGAVTLEWQEHLRDATVFDVPSESRFERLLGTRGITDETTVVFYGDTQNWFAAYAYWLLRYYGHRDVRLLDGGRDIWLASGRETTDVVPSYAERSYRIGGVEDSIRIDREGVRAAMEGDEHLVDVRAPAEFRGEILSPPGWNESVQRGGHIPGAINVPWSRVVQPTGRFKPAAEMRAVFAEAGLDTDDDIVVYCRIGERSALTWVALHELLDFDAVRHYYGSWVEWGNTVGAPVANGREAGP
ncbi:MULTISPECIES: sulfurtransferase [Salinibaculum]|uniref:sulfurtransferase n=1 Tax=Salinibaculum TaxID=2732368 RepID=UPI0030D34194